MQASKTSADVVLVQPLIREREQETPQPPLTAKHGHMAARRHMSSAGLREVKLCEE